MREGGWEGGWEGEGLWGWEGSASGGLPGECCSARRPMHKSKCWMSVAAQSKNATSLGARNANKRSVELGQLSWAI